MGAEAFVSSAGLTDEIIVELNPEPWDAPEPGPSLPARPGDKASRAKWVAYVVALGADEHYVENDTLHFKNLTDDGRPVYYGSPPLTRAQLVELADKLGG